MGFLNFFLFLTFREDIKSFLSIPYMPYLENNENHSSDSLKFQGFTNFLLINLESSYHQHYIHKFSNITASKYLQFIQFYYITPQDFIIFSYFIVLLVCTNKSIQSYSWIFR